MLAALTIAAILTAPGFAFVVGRILVGEGA